MLIPVTVVPVTNRAPWEIASPAIASMARRRSSCHSCVRLSAFSRVIFFDRSGTGASDRLPLDQLAERLGKRGLIVLISDLLAPIIGVPKGTLTMHQNVTVAQSVIASSRRGAVRGGGV